MAIAPFDFAVPRDASDVKNGDVIIAEQEGRWYLGIHVTVADERRVLLLRLLAGERPAALSLPMWPPIRQFSCYSIEGSFVVRPKDALKPHTDDQQPPDGSIAVNAAGMVFLRRNDGNVTYTDLASGEWVGSQTGQGERLFYDEWELVRRVGNTEEIVVAYPDHRIRPLPRVTG